MDELNYVESIFEGTILAPGYGYVSRMVMRDKTLSRDAKAIYAYISSFAGNKMTAFPGWKTICTELGFKSKDTYYKYMNELKNRGFIKVTQKKEKGKFNSNIYRLVLRLEEIQGLEPLPNKSESVNLGNGNNGNRKNQESNKNKSLNNNKKINKNTLNKGEKKNIFNDFEQRNYDFDELEKKLLGWDRNDNL